MGILLAFAPFIVFALGDRLAGPTQGLIAGAAVSAALLIRDLLSRNALGSGRVPKLLEVGSVALFGGLALYALLGAPAWTIIEVRLLVDAGLLLIVLMSIGLRRPFTLQYARERVAREYWVRPEFIWTNYVITSIWALTFGILVAADVGMLYSPDSVSWPAITVTLLALVAAVIFTAWYPKHVRAKAGPPRVPTGR